MGIGGTWSCLEDAAGAGSIPYSKDAALTSCPLSSVFPSHASFENICPKSMTPLQAQNYWDSAPKTTNFTGVPNYNMSSELWGCPLDEPFDPPSSTRWETCGLNRDAAPQAGKPVNPYEPSAVQTPTVL